MTDAGFGLLFAGAGFAWWFGAIFVTTGALRWFAGFMATGIGLLLLYCWLAYRWLGLGP